MATWWFIARDDEAPGMLEEEQGDRPVLAIESDERELSALGDAIGAKYEPAVIFVIDDARSIVRVPTVFASTLARLGDVARAARLWSDSIGRQDASMAEMLTEMRDFAIEALKGPGIVSYRER